MDSEVNKMKNERMKNEDFNLALNLLTSSNSDKDRTGPVTLISNSLKLTIPENKSKMFI